MKHLGMVDAPFQLMINVIVFGMVIAIGFYLYENVTCWRCNELLKVQVTNLAEKIASAGHGSSSTFLPHTVKIEDIGTCAKGIYLKHLNSSAGYKCSSFCPERKGSCWVIISESTCGGMSLEPECVDVSGETHISADPTVLGRIQSEEDAQLNGAYAFIHNTMISIQVIGSDSIYIGKQ